MSFVFYDLETTGVDVRHDQILQFAAIRTDPDLVEKERVELRCRLDRHVVPHPEALVLTERSLDDIRDPALPSHYAMMCEVARVLEGWSPSTLIGFNSIRFDEEVIRHSLWRTLHNPFLTNWNGNVRGDALTLCRTVAFFSPGALVVPEDDLGRPRFKLRRLCEANGIGLRNAHDAMADAEATLALCRLVLGTDEETWWRFLRFASKAAAAALVDDGQAFGAVRFRGNEPRPVAAVMVGTSPTDANRRHCLDLACDLEALAGLADEALRVLLAEPDSPAFALRVNACPALCEIWDLPGAARYGLDDAACDERAMRVREDPRLASRLAALLEELRPVRPPSPYLEEQLYDALPCRVDDEPRRQFHQMDWSNRSALLRRCEDERVRRLGRRLIFLEAPHVLPEATRVRLDADVTSRLAGAAGTSPWRTVADAIEAAVAMGGRCPRVLQDELTMLVRTT